jgi:RecA-family ATPase
MPKKDDIADKIADFIAASDHFVGADSLAQTRPDLVEELDYFPRQDDPWAVEELQWKPTPGVWDDQAMPEIKDLDYSPPGNGHDARTICFDAKAAAKIIIQPPIVLKVINPATDWEGKKAPPRESIVPGYFPDRNVALLYGDGGTGKSLLIAQLAVARALAREWIGLLPEPGRTLVLSTEDDGDEMWRRVEGILPFYEAAMKDIADARFVDLVGENSVLGLLSKGIVEPTPMYCALNELIGDFKPGLVCLDVLADLFSGSEIDRNQVTQFIGLLRRLCRAHSCGIILTAQPSVAGINSGSGTSGSTGWSNAGRARAYFHRVKGQDGTEPNKDLRTFKGMKNNYGEIGGPIDVVYKNGLFRCVEGPTGFDKMAAEAKANDAFMTTLKRFNAQGRNASDYNGTSFAPALFAKEPDNQGITKEQFAAAMRRLFQDNKIHKVDHGRPSKPAWTLKPVEAKNDEK